MASTGAAPAQERAKTPSCRRWRNRRGSFSGTMQLSSGTFAIVEKSQEFTLIPWRPIIDRQLGREVAGIMQGGSVSWQLGRQRGLGL
ncbi:hypothetical protein D3C80_2041640 [compost metagenome]